ncbi:MAG: cupin domain-containing protein [Candidatus Aminicenantes bacterium]|nr:cupin domain-containing protein [Candidatus Aminicenantes bacterium]
MPKRLFILLAASAVVAISLAHAQQKTDVTPAPSYREDADWNRRHPGLDTDVSLYLNQWRDSPPHEGHGGLVEREILRRGDPFKPAQKGAVLRFLKTYNQAELAGGAETRDYSDPREQVFLYVMNGRGTLTIKDKAVALEDGSAVVIPPGITYRLKNPGLAPLELLLAAEETPADFVPNRTISVGRCGDSLPLLGAHWAHIARPFIYDIEPKFRNPMGFVPVSIDEFDIAQPHSHPAAAEEIWLQVKGRSLLLLGNRLFNQEPGEAFLVPPNNLVPHSSINAGGEPMLWLFFGCRK